MPWNSIKSLFSGPESKTISPEFFALLQLFGHPWFERIWIIQEVVLAKTVTVLYGSEEVPWNTLHYVVLVLGMVGTPKWTSPLTEAETFLMRCCLPSSMLNMCQMGQIQVIYAITGMRTPFDQLMRRFITCRAACQKDKIFALLALSDEAEEGQAPNGRLAFYTGYY